LELSGYVYPENRQGFDYWAAIEVNHDYIDWYYYTGNSTVMQHEVGFEPDLQTNRAIEFMSEHKDDTFALMISWGTPHYWCCPADKKMPEDKNRYKSPTAFANIHDPNKVPIRPNVPAEKVSLARKEIAGAYNMVANIDYNIGRLTAAIDSLGIANNTIIIFTSDHGDMLQSHGLINKQSPYEESAHVPFIIRYPNKIVGGQKTDLLFNSVDIMPTILGSAGVAVPAGVQGTNNAPYLMGQSTNQNDAVYFSQGHQDKVMNDFGYRGNFIGVRTKGWLYTANENGDWMMFNIKDDPYQMTNLISDPDYATKREELRSLTLQKKAKYKDPFPVDTKGWSSAKNSPLLVILPQI
jgi:arylsulfatase A-like enzyme